MVDAARKAGGAATRVSLAEEPLATVPEEHQKAVIDVISIHLNDDSARPAIEQLLDNIARRYGMVRTPEVTTDSVVSWDYQMDGVSRQEIRLILAPAAESTAAVPVHKGASKLAIIIDDLGYDRAADDAVFGLPRPLTVSVLPNLPLSHETAEEAHARGFQVVLHMPMEPESATVQHETIQLEPGMSKGQVSEILASMLSTVPFAAGVNNHEGSLATADPQLMAILMPELRARQLFFIDSRTTAQTVAYETAKKDGVKAGYRKVFLDDTPTREAVLAQIALAERDAKQTGWAIAIGHPHPETIGALREALPHTQSAGIQLVFASDLTR